MKNKTKQALSNIDNGLDDKNLPIDVYLLMIVILFGSVIIFASQIYIKNNIYYKSRSINKLYRQYQSLKDENNKLKLILEKLYFQQNKQE